MNVLLQREEGIYLRVSDLEARILELEDEVKDLKAWKKRRLLRGD